jgi:hypothetical protein
MSVWGGENYVTEAAFDVKLIAPGVGQIVCPECRGDQERYRSLFPPELGVEHCVDCEGIGRIFVSI